MKKFFLKILPYIISILIGLILFFIVKKIESKSEDVSNLLINIASDLLSIPFVFISYEVVSRICNQDLRNALFKSTNFEINTIILNILNEIKIFINYKENINETNIYDFLRLNKKINTKQLIVDNINEEILNNFQQDKNLLSSIIKKPTTLEVLDNDQIKILLSLFKEINLLYNKLSLIKNEKINLQEKIFIAENFSTILKTIKEWLENLETDTLINYKNIKL